MTIPRKTIFTATNRHSGNNAPDAPEHGYKGYFENMHGEQFVFVYEKESGFCYVYMGDNPDEDTWTKMEIHPHENPSSLLKRHVLEISEYLWICSCWQSATWQQIPELTLFSQWHNMANLPDRLRR